MPQVSGGILNGMPENIRGIHNPSLLCAISATASSHGDLSCDVTHSIGGEYTRKSWNIDRRGASSAG